MEGYVMTGRVEENGRVWVEVVMKGVGWSW